MIETKEGLPNWREGLTSEEQNMHFFQHYYAAYFGMNDKSVINVGCKEDPAQIGLTSKNVVNLDAMEYDPSTHSDIKGEVKNYVQADFLNWDDPRKFEVLVLGEVLEHCSATKFIEMIVKCNQRLEMDGHIVITVPQDNRPKNKQYSRDEEFFEYAPGITSWHQLYVTRPMLEGALGEHGFKILLYDSIPWFGDVFWHCVTARKIKDE